MQTAVGIHDFVLRSNTNFGDAVNSVVEAERLGVDCVWSAEAWGTDAVVPLAFVAARTTLIRIASGIIQITARAPAMTAMTAMTLDYVSGGRFTLGLGVSGPQVVEGLHGVRYARPLERLQETVEVIRMATRGDKVAFEGRQIVLPLPGGQGKPLRIGQPPRPGLPIYLATLGPKALEYTGREADGWVGTCFIPEAASYFVDHIRQGAAAAGRSLSEIAIYAGGPVAFAADPEPLLAARKKAIAFQVSAMGSPTTNFYHDAFARLGYAEEVDRVRQIYLSGRHDDASEAVPDDLALQTSLFGDEKAVTERIRAYRRAGVTELRLEPMGRTAAERLDTLGAAVELVRAVNAED